MSQQQKQQTAKQCAGKAQPDKLQKDVIQVTKEIVVKFIEAGRLSPANFGEIFPSVYQVVQNTLQSAEDNPPAKENAKAQEENSK